MSEPGSPIAAVLEGIVDRANAELREMKQEDLERFWFFKFDPTKSLEWNLYEFQDMLGLYRSKCRSWEEMHNGCCCVVERVRDTYLMPKVREFAAAFRAVKYEPPAVPANGSEGLHA